KTKRAGRSLPARSIPRLCLFGRLVGRKDNEELPLSSEDLTRVTRENRGDIDSLEERLTAIEKPESKRKTANGKDTNVLRLPPFA
ncbi:hypothetical protein, partial [Rhizobium johnstonii]|uniref:hypothetical protein n=1 Tax=Rhizobium johnstonii TaxID=3019933 RepID=UPI003F98DE4F